jgi:hypothetical protein
MDKVLHAAQVIAAVVGIALVGAVGLMFMIAGFAVLTKEEDRYVSPDVEPVGDWSHMPSVVDPLASTSRQKTAAGHLRAIQRPPARDQDVPRAPWHDTITPDERLKFIHQRRVLRNAAPKRTH